VLTSPESAVSGILYSTMTFDHLTPHCDMFVSVTYCITAVSLVKCVKYSARYHVDVSGRKHERTRGRTGQKQYASSHTTLGGGIKTVTDDHIPDYYCF